MNRLWSAFAFISVLALPLSGRAEDDSTVTIKKGSTTVQTGDSSVQVDENGIKVTGASGSGSGNSWPTTTSPARWIARGGP